MKFRNICLLLCLLCAQIVFAAMTDAQVIDYIKKQTAAGKNYEQIGKELLAKGVTKEQVQRIRTRIDKESTAETQFLATEPMVKEEQTGRESQESGEIKNEDELNQSSTARRIFGHDVFGTRTLTFEPGENLATPKDYQLGPGDQIIIDIWGASEDHITETISPEGSIMISQIGPVYLNGMTIEQATSFIRNTFAQKYAGVENDSTEIQVNLGQARTIQVDLLGELMMPGTFRMSPFSNVFHALYRAGGINDIGTLRDVQVVRNGRIVARVDLYDYLFNGNSKGNIRLQEGDAIIVHPYGQLVSIEGNVKRPMYYEIKENETIDDILQFAGGFTGDAYESMVTIARQSGTENELHNVAKEQFPSWALQDGDVITVGNILDRFANRVEVKGAVFRPGYFAITGDLATVGDLIRKADGVTEDAFVDHVLLYREGPDKRLNVTALNLGAIMNGTARDVSLQPNDVLVISSIFELEEEQTVFIGGHVANPGTFPYAVNMTVDDLIFQAGGLLKGASTARVDVSRRIVNPSSTTPTQELATVYSVSLDNGEANDRQTGFILKPFDCVIVRRSPGYGEQEFVTINGEVLFAGDYVLQKRNERLSEVVARAGGVLDDAYIKGAHLSRQLTRAEYEARREVLRLAQANSTTGADSIALSRINVASTYNVGIDLAMALQNPGSTYDVVLEPGDVLYVPPMQSTVKISGEVLFPNAVVYVPGKKLGYYIDQAGGYGQNARKGKAFVVYLNGTVARAKKSTPIEPGCQIIVPSKPASGTDWSKILSIATTFSSVAAMGATITNIFRR